MSIEEKKQEIREMVEEAEALGRDDLMKTYGFILGLKAQGQETTAAVQPG